MENGNLLAILDFKSIFSETSIYNWERITRKCITWKV